MRGRGVGLVAVLGPLALGACELGDPVNGGPGTGADTTVNILSTPTLDGYAGSNGASGTALAQGLTGDLLSLASVGFRQFYSFDISAIPSGSTIVSATVRLHQGGTAGSPYGLLGNVLLDHVDYGAVLEAADYAVPALSTPGTLSTNTTLEYKQLAVTAQVQADITASRTRSQFRLRFSTADFSNNGLSDHVEFTDAEAPGNNPVLIVRYRAPVP